MINKPENIDTKLSKFGTIIGAVLFIQSTILFIGSLIEALTSEDTDKWFTRFALAVICIGFSGIIFKIKK